MATLNRRLFLKKMGAAGLGNIKTIEGVTCISDDIDYGDYPIREGKLQVSDAPGFGMRLLI
jgi:hypothetical protein